MHNSPKSLQAVCIDFICEHILSICNVHFEEEPNEEEEKPIPIGYENGMRPPTWLPVCKPALTNAEKSGYKFRKDTPLDDVILRGAVRLTFKNPNIYLPAEVSEMLLSSLCDRESLCNLAMTLFNCKTTRLRHVTLKDASGLSFKGLKMLKQHKVTDLVVNCLRITVNDLISCLSDWTLQNLRTLSVAKGIFTNYSRYCVVVTLSKLRALQTLNVAATEFNKHALEIVAEDLPLLENLDISCTRVDDITPLKKCKDRLKTLTMYNLKIGASLIPVLLELRELRNLDISDEKEAHAFDMFGPKKPQVAELLQAVEAMPYLTSLDISGREEIDAEDLKNFIKHHPHLRFLGLVHSDICYDESLTDPSHEDYRPGLVVSGTATESQILEGLKRYISRPVYIQKCLFNLFLLTPNFLEPRVDVIKLVLPGMKEHAHEFRVQMAATACLYNLTKGELASMIHPAILKEIVELTLSAMETYPDHYQLQKNTLLTLCSDRILQDVTFDKYRCARLVMNCLSTFDDASTNRMSVAICSILAAKISTVETSMLGAQPQYMAKLLNMVRSKLQAKSVDITMKFTLSALWNLTDESATTCKVFLDEGGMELFLEVLESFQGESSIETKVLGLLNNIAEVAQLRPLLMQPRFLKMLSLLLDSMHIDVSYFAAGIAAHLLSDGPGTWAGMPVHPSREHLLEQLARAVTQWQTPQGEMVAYRSFQPFFPLLRCKDAYPVQLWAAWAIHHVCTKNPKRYCSMLTKEDGVETLRELQKTHAEHTERTEEPNLRSLCQSILETLESNPC